MPVPVLLLALAPVAAQLPEPERCVGPGAARAADRQKQPPRARPLNEMPDARPVLTVYHRVDGCNVLLIRDGGRIVEEPVGRPEQRRVFRP